MNWIKALIAKIFSKSPAPVIPINPGAETKAPIQQNAGNPRNPDWKVLWETCLLDFTRLDEVAKVCAKIIANKDKYLAVEAKTKVPWYLIAALHYRESSLNFKTCLHNGDLLPGPTKNVPRGRGPFASWEQAAIDALIYDGLNHITFDSIEACLVMAEKFNGLGYRKTGEYSPYVWAGTNHSDETGKYVSDGRFSATAKEQQLGVAAILKGLNV